jgi:SagB-type dehydrogenase family enzyme
MAAFEAIKFRRSRHLVFYWQGRELVIYNYATGKCVSSAPVTFEILRFFSRWSRAEGLMRRLAGFSRSSLRDAIVLLADHSFLLRSDRDPPAPDRLMDGWSTWSPAAAFYHFSTKDPPYDTAFEARERWLADHARRNPAPAAVKSYPASRRVVLSPVRATGDVPDMLLARRTWRRFSRRRLDAKAFSTLLWLTWGVQTWARTPSQPRVALKTSPSGGACHPIEVYTLVRRVSGLRAGLYHYDPANHVLDSIRNGASARQLLTYTCGQWWYRDAAALFIMTAVFPRTQWRYRYPRAYRSVLLEAGHLCQTFCLAATWLELAPFCTAVLADSRIERDLRLDGITESVIYAAGVGCRPLSRNWGRADFFPGTPVGEIGR